MITVHHLNNSRSQRILWLLEELGVPYEIKRYQRDTKTMLAPPELRTAHPLGKSPVVTNGMLTVAESGAIVEYLADRYGEGRLLAPYGARPSACVRTTGCTTPKARRCRRCCSSWCSSGWPARRHRSLSGQ
jgi:glutathione S-transferase